MGACTMLSKVNTLVNVGYGEELDNDLRSSLVNHEQSSFTELQTDEFRGKQSSLENLEQSALENHEQNSFTNLRKAIKKNI